MAVGKDLLPGTVRAADAAIEIGLNAAIVTVHNDQPQILVTSAGTRRGEEWDALPFGPFSPQDHRTLEIGLRRWVKAQTQLELGYVEQLYTFGDRGRHAMEVDQGPHAVSVGYLALTRHAAGKRLPGAAWSPWYVYLPWEDWRDGKPDILDSDIEPRLKDWATRAPERDEPVRALSRAERLRICFAIGGAGLRRGESGLPPSRRARAPLRRDGGRPGGAGWDEEKALERYELLYEAGLVAEAARDGRQAAAQWSNRPSVGRPMQHDHRRILATAMGRLRGKLKYRPVVFELLPETFTLFELQKVVEAILGGHLHKQNFRRLVENAGLVEPTGEVSRATGGRPARLYRFRREVLMERPAPGVRIKAGRG